MFEVICLPHARIRLAFCATAHFVVDYVCFFALYSGPLQTESAALYVLLYNALAFTLQAPIGAFCDRLEDARPLAIAGCGLVALGAMAMGYPLASVALLGLGNACYHVGGAVACLRHCPGDALPAGVFVAPGALGTVLGLLAAQRQSTTPMYTVFLLLVCILLIWGVGPGVGRQYKATPSKNKPIPLGAGALMLCLCAIAVRSFAGFAADPPRGTAGLLLGGAASFAGKLLGGAWGHKLPWRTVALLGVGLGGLIMAFFPQSMALCAGVFLFNLAMPLTLAAVTASLPGHYGLGFGLTTLALFAGSTPLYGLPNGYAAPPLFMAGLTLAAALTLFFLLRPESSRSLRPESSRSWRSQSQLQPQSQFPFTGQNEKEDAIHDTPPLA